MTYDEVLKEPSDNEKILEFICDIKRPNGEGDFYEGWNLALSEVEYFIENKL